MQPEGLPNLVGNWLNQWIDSDQTTLSGAVSTGDIWQFGVTRSDQQIIQDINLYRVPADLEELFRILVEILSPAIPPAC